MSLFRRRRPLHERLAADAGLQLEGTVDQAGPAAVLGPPPAPSPPRAAGVRGALGASAGLLAPPDLLGQPSRFGEVAFHGVARPRRWDAVATAEAELPGAQHEFVALADGTLVVGHDVPDGALAPLADAVEGAGARPPYRAFALRHDKRRWAVGAVEIEVRTMPAEDGEEFERVEGDVVTRGRRIDGDLWEVEEHRL